MQDSTLHKTDKNDNLSPQMLYFFQFFFLLFGIHSNQTKQFVLIEIFDRKNLATTHICDVSKKYNKRYHLITTIKSDFIQFSLNRNAHY